MHRTVTRLDGARNWTHVGRLNESCKTDSSIPGDYGARGRKLSISTMRSANPSADLHNAGESAPRLSLQPTLAINAEQYQEIGRILASAKQASESDAEWHIVVAHGRIALILAGKPESLKRRTRASFNKNRNPLKARTLNRGFASDRAGGHAHDDTYNLQVSRAEAWINLHLTEPIGVQDVASALGVCTRTLQLAFRCARGYSPLRAILLRRLDRVHAALAAAKPSATVTDIATSFGFFELGRFSVRYRQQFGEKPSETLARGLGWNSRKDCADGGKAAMAAKIA